MDILNRKIYKVSNIKAYNEALIYIFHSRVTLKHILEQKHDKEINPRQHPIR